MAKKSGFTLIELMVTISIIAVLSAIALVAYSSVMKQGRDSKRKADFGAIQSALEQYSSDQGFYPSTIDFTTSLTNATGNSSGTVVTKTYMNNIPVDPLPAPHDQYSYVSSPGSCDNDTAVKCTTYCLYAVLENPPSTPPAAPIGCQYNTNNYAVSSP